MASFPANWNVYPASEYATYALDDVVDQDFGAQLLVLMQHKAIDFPSFRFLVYGADLFNAEFPIARLVPSFTEMPGYLLFQASGDDVSPPQNTTVGPWLDLEQLLEEKKVVMRDADHQFVSPAPLIHHLARMSGDKHISGASVRWALNVSKSMKLKVVLQGMPTAAKALTKDCLKRENSVSIALCQMELQVECFDDASPVRGPVPLFFAEDMPAAFETLNAHPSSLARAIQAINGRLLLAEYMATSQAITYLQVQTHLTT